MYELKIRVTNKKRVSGLGHACAYIQLRTRRFRRMKLPYWLITLCDPAFHECPFDPFISTILAINHEVMHGILYEIAGDSAYWGWDNVVDSIAQYLPDVYCAEGDPNVQLR